MFIERTPTLGRTLRCWSACSRSSRCPTDEVHGSIRCIEAKRRKKSIRTQESLHVPTFHKKIRNRWREHIHWWDRARKRETFLIIRIRCWRQGWDIRYGWLSRKRSSCCRSIRIRCRWLLLQLIDRLLNIDVHQTLLKRKKQTCCRSIDVDRWRKKRSIQNPLVATVEWMECYRNGIQWSSLWRVNREPSFSLLRLPQE